MIIKIIIYCFWLDLKEIYMSFVVDFVMFDLLRSFKLKVPYYYEPLM